MDPILDKKKKIVFFTARIKMEQTFFSFDLRNALLKFDDKQNGILDKRDQELVNQLKKKQVMNSFCS